jgi:hypothetical protein
MSTEGQNLKYLSKNIYTTENDFDEDQRQSLNTTENNFIVLHYKSTFKHFAYAKMNLSKNVKSETKIRVP